MILSPTRCILSIRNTTGRVLSILTLESIHITP